MIDFEDYPPGTFVVGQYQDKGVIVNEAQIVRDANVAYSGQQYVSAYAPTGVENPIPVKFTFPNFAKSVSMYAGTSALVPGSAFATFHVDSGSGAQIIASDPPIGTPKAVGHTCQTRFSVSTASFDIRSVTLSAFVIDAGNVTIPSVVIDHVEFEPGPPVHVPAIEHGLMWHILYGIRLGERGIQWGPHGPEPVPPIGPEERAILAAFVANGVAQIIGDAGSRRAIQRAALGVIAQEANRLSESL